MAGSTSLATPILNPPEATLLGPSTKGFESQRVPLLQGRIVLTGFRTRDADTVQDPEMPDIKLIKLSSILKLRAAESLPHFLLFSVCSSCAKNTRDFDLKRILFRIGVDIE